MSTGTAQFDFFDAVVLVAGGGTGIGLAITRALLASGATVVVTGRRQEALDEALVTRPQEGSGHARRPGRQHRRLLPPGQADAARLRPQRRNLVTGCSVSGLLGDWGQAASNGSRPPSPPLCGPWL